MVIHGSKVTLGLSQVMMSTFSHDNEEPIEGVVKTTRKKKKDILVKLRHSEDADFRCFE